MNLPSLARLRGLNIERVRRSLEMRSLFLFGRFDPVRALARGLGRSDGSPPRSMLFPDFDPTRALDDLERDGLHLRLQLRDSERDEILAWARDTACYGNQNYAWGFRVPGKAEAERRAGKAFAVGFYANTANCPAIRRLGEDPALLHVARCYVGAHARLRVSRLWWSFAGDIDATDRNEHAQRYHFDLDDYRFLKVFFYLTDVDADAGPHVYVRGSHRGKSLRHLFPMRRFTDAEVEQVYHPSRIVSIEGRAGEGFLEDTFGIHKGSPPVKHDRLLLQFEYAVHDYGINDEVSPERLKMLVD